MRWIYLIAAVALALVMTVPGRVLPNSWRETGALPLLGVVLISVSGIFYVTLLGLVTAQAIGVLAFVEPVSAALLAGAILDQSIGAAVLVGARWCSSREPWSWSGSLRMPPRSRFRR